MNRLLVALALLSGCTGVSARAEKIRQFKGQTEMPGCEFLATMTGTSGWGGSAGNSMGINNARNEVLDRAAGMDATHVVWLEGNASWATTVTGEAWKCPTTRATQPTGAPNKH